MFRTHVSGVCPVCSVRPLCTWFVVAFTVFMVYHVCMYVCMYVCRCVCMCMYVCTYVCMYIVQRVCHMLWLCCAAVLARRKLSKGGPQATKTARDLGKASYVVSIIGIIVVVIILFAVLIACILVPVSHPLLFSWVERPLHKFWDFIGDHKYRQMLDYVTITPEVFSARNSSLIHWQAVLFYTTEPAIANWNKR